MAGRADNGRFAAGLLDPDIDIPEFVAGRAQGEARPPHRRYAVYRNNVVVGLMEALKAAYPSLHAIMGEDAFLRVGRNFILSCPPRSAMMQGFGEGFADFLAGFPPLARSPFLSDVARLERAWLDAFHAADADALEAGDLDGLDAEAVMALAFEPHPALAIVESAFPLGDLFAFREGLPAEAPDLSVSQAVLVTRPELEVRVTTVAAHQARFLRLLSAGETLGMAAESLLAEDPEFDLAAALGLVFATGAFRKSGRRSS